MRWDAAYLYVGAELFEPFVFANLTGHNEVAPYHDNDFEFFVDPAGSTEYYKEYEMSAANATYDVLWGVPDGWGLHCDDGGGGVLPTCVNTSFPGYAGSWTMADGRGGAAGGLRAATDTPVWGQYVEPNASWSLEIAFPLRGQLSGGGGPHGGLLDADAAAMAAGYADNDPARGDAAPGLPRFWWMDFARAEHPRVYTLAAAQGAAAAMAVAGSGGGTAAAAAAAAVSAAAAAATTTMTCPFNCSSALLGATPDLAAPTTAQCAAAKAAWPTLLGTDIYSCYWEWVWQDLGAEAYMHRPHLWGMLQFVDGGGGSGGGGGRGGSGGGDGSGGSGGSGGSSRQHKCRNIEHPGRHLAAQLHLAQRSYAAAHNGSFATDPAALLAVCAADAAAKGALGCDAAALSLATARPDVFTLGPVVVTENATALTRACTARPCYSATVGVAVPASSGRGAAADDVGDGAQHSYAVTINENHFVRVTHDAVKPGALVPCL